VAKRAVATTAEQLETDDQQEQDDRYDPKHLHPAWSAGGRAAGAYVGVVVDVRSE
jgi:hypothetical protein